MAALFTRMSTRAEPGDGGGHAGLGLVGLAGVGGEHVDVGAGVARRISAAAASRSSILRDDSITAAPLAASSAAMARPIPRDAPVTSATLPSIRRSMPADSTTPTGREEPPLG